MLDALPIKLDSFQLGTLQLVSALSLLPVLRAWKTLLQPLKVSAGT